MRGAHRDDGSAQERFATLEELLAVVEDPATERRLVSRLAAVRRRILSTALHRHMPDSAS